MSIKYELKLSKEAIDLRKKAVAKIVTALSKFGRLIFEDGEGSPIADLAIGSKDPESKIYPELYLIDNAGIHCYDGESEEVLFTFSQYRNGNYLGHALNLTPTEEGVKDEITIDLDLSTDDLCCIADAIDSMQEATYDIETDNGDWQRGLTYENLLLVDAVLKENGWWKLVEINFQ